MAEIQSLYALQFLKCSLERSMHLKAYGIHVYLMKDVIHILRQEN